MGQTSGYPLGQPWNVSRLLPSRLQCMITSSFLLLMPVPDSLQNHPMLLSRHANGFDATDQTRKNEIKFSFCHLVPTHLEMSHWASSQTMRAPGWIVARTAIHHGGPPIFWKHRERKFFLWFCRCAWKHLVSLRVSDNVRSPSTYRRAEARRSSKSFG